MIIDGKVIAEELAHALKKRAESVRPVLAIISVAPNFATKRYLAIKQRFAERIGAAIALTELAESAATEEVVAAIMSARHAHGIVLQLPFPAQIDVQEALAALPKEQDVDVIGAEASAAFASGDRMIAPPVVGAIAHIAERYGVDFSHAKVCVIGKGRLVGVPASLWAQAKGADVTSVGKEDDIQTPLREADIVISGAGVPSLIMPDMLSPGVAVFDAGTSEDEGKLAGDADPACAEVAGVFTPVPGGIGPVAVAKLFENLLILAEKHK